MLLTSAILRGCSEISHLCSTASYTIPPALSCVADGPHTMMRYQRGTFLVSILLGVSLLLPCLALQANLAGIVDWHKPLIGPPLLEPTPPRLVETSKGRVVVGLTRKNVLACLDAKTGDIGMFTTREEAHGAVWRYHFEEIDPVVSYHVHDDGE